jgi:AcrR family transcriptional regulator
MDGRTGLKERNRETVKATAAKIIRREGMAALTMRRLAETAGVSLKTPYNLFGSKTGVLVALIEESLVGLAHALAVQRNRLVVEELLAGIDRMRDFFAQDEAFYRDVYWGIMSAEQSDARTAGYDRAIAFVQAAVARAVANGELDPDIDAPRLGKHLAVQLMAILGMWGSGYFENEECTAHIKRAWSTSLLPGATRKSEPALSQALAPTRKRGRS